MKTTSVQAPFFCFVVSLALLFLDGVTVAAEPMRIVIHDLPEDVRAATTSLNPQFLVATPAAANRDRKLPLIIYLHGGGAGGSDITKLREKLSIKYYNKQQKQPFLIVVPQVMPQEQGEHTLWEAKDLDLLFAELKKTVAFDESRVYLTGFSMGGYGTWAWASASPQHFAAIVPHAGGLGRGGPKDVTPDLDQWVERLAALPIWIFHGANDKVVPAERSERMFNALKSKGASRVELTVLPDKGHAIGGNYWNKGMYDWLLRHSRRGDQVILRDAKPAPADASSKSPAKELAPTLTADEIGPPPSPPAGWTDGYVIGNGIRIHYWRTGGDKPPMVMAHGSPDEGLCWTNLAKELEEDYDIVLADARGHGLSDPGSAADPADVQAEDLAALIRELKLDKPIVMGHSMGSASAMWFAANYPDVPGAVILEDPRLIPRPPGDQSRVPDRFLRKITNRFERNKPNAL